MHSVTPDAVTSHSLLVSTTGLLIISILHREKLYSLPRSYLCAFQGKVTTESVTARLLWRGVAGTFIVNV